MRVESRGQIGVTIGICAYNEERNIARLLEALLSQKTEVARVEEILVVASGCTDRTPQIVEEFHMDHSDIRLIVEEERRGKASAINEILQQAESEVVILESADTIPAPEAVERLICPFDDASLGVVAAHPISTDDESTFWGGVSHVLWDLHHRVSLQDPKTGEMFAFRRVLKKLPRDVGADEDWIRHEVEKRGYRVIYESLAVVYNSGPKSIREFLNQRIRINTQQLYQGRTFSYMPPTWRTRFLVNALLAHLESEDARPVIVFTLLGLEVAARIYSGLYRALNPQNIVRWEPLPSTKVIVIEDQGDEEERHA